MSSRASIGVHALQVSYSDDGCAIAELGPACIAVWRGHVTATRFERQRAMLEDVATRYRPKAAFLCIVEENAPAPNTAMRKAGVEMMAAHDKELCCAAMVIEGAGFKAAITRSVLIGMSVLLGERSYPVSYFATVVEATHWICKRTALPPASFVRDIEELRACMVDAGRAQIRARR